MPLTIERPAGDSPRRGSDEAERAEAAAQAAASPTSGERSRWQAVAARQQEARDEAAAKLRTVGVGVHAIESALSKAELPAAEDKLDRAKAWLADLDERTAIKKKECEQAADECVQLQELKSGTRTRADMERLLMSIAVRASETCAAAEEHAVQAVAALREPEGLKGLMEVAAWQEPPPDARSIFQAVVCLLSGVRGVGSTGPKDLEWATTVCGTSGLLADPAEFVESLSPARTNFLKATADGQAPQFTQNATEARALMGQHVGRNLAMDELDDVQSLQTIQLPRNRAVALVCRWVVAHLAYQDAQLLLEERAGEAAFELKDHELSQHRGLHAALLAQREQASSAVKGQAEMVKKLRSTESVLAIEEAAWDDAKTAQVAEVIAEYSTTLQEQIDEFEEGDGEEEHEGDEDEEFDEEEQVRTGAAALIQSRARGNATRKRVAGLKQPATEREQDVAAVARTEEELDAAAQLIQSAVASATTGGLKSAAIVDSAGSSSISTRSKSGKKLAVDISAVPNFEFLGPVPEPGMESGVLTVDSPPDAVAAATAAATGAEQADETSSSGTSAAEKKAEFQKALQEFNSESAAE